MPERMRTYTRMRVVYATPTGKQAGGNDRAYVGRGGLTIEAVMGERFPFV